MRPRSDRMACSGHAAPGYVSAQSWKSRIMWTLCRYRHNVHYPDTVVMPIPGGPALAGGGERVLGIGIIERAAA